MLTKQLTDDFTWVGTLDPELRLFDIVVKTEYGSTYNSYILKADSGNVLFEASKSKFYDKYIETVEQICPLKDIKYLVVSHTEPDHTGTIEKMLEANPELTVISSMAGNNFLKEIVNKDFNSIVVKDGEEIDLGNRTLRFIIAPNLHWPDTMLTYIPEEKILVTCDFFGGHYCDEHITIDKIRDREEYYDAVRFYYESIMRPFSEDVKNACKKIKDIDIDLIANGHGPVIVDHVDDIINLYKELSAVPKLNDRKTVIMPYVSAYGYTKLLGEHIRDGIISAGDIDVKMHDMTVADFDMVMDELFHADGFLLGTPTMVGEALEPIWEITSHMKAKTHGGKLASAFGSYGWSGEGVPYIMQRLDQIKVKRYEDGIKFRFKPNDDELKEAFEFGKGFGEAILKEEV